MLASLENQAIALAGVFQATKLVKDLAHTGRCEQRPFEDSLHSVLTSNASSVAEIYADNAALRTGLHVLSDQLENLSTQRDQELSRYVITVIHLESRLRKSPSILERLRQGLQQLESQANINGLNDQVIQAMAELYRDTISQLTPRIMVNGESRHLADDYTAAKIRALLLSAMRSAVLWKQAGGSRLKLLFQRKAYLEETGRLIEKLPLV